MTFVITQACIDIKDGACTDVCPVDCIYEGGRMYYIHPIECVHCGLCESICPVDAIRSDEFMAKEEELFLNVNKDYFGPEVTRLGSPGGWTPDNTSSKDHPVVAQWTIQSKDQT